MEDPPAADDYMMEEGAKLDDEENAMDMAKEDNDDCYHEESDSTDKHIIDEIGYNTTVLSKKDCYYDAFNMSYSDKKRRKIQII